MREPRVLDITKEQDVRYAIPLWLRDEQIKRALEKVKGRIQPHYERRPEPIAVVGFGPSLNDTWEKIRDFQFIISCSGSHKFLLERGLVPNWHVEVDPREHKVPLLGPPDPRVTYLPSSTCHPKYFEHLEQGLGKELFDKNVLLWHVFDATEDGARLLPHGEWAITGGCDVGLRAMTIAGFLGFRDLHVFGIDGCARGSTKHAAAHPNAPKKFDTVEYNGVTYETTAGMLQSARQVWHELDQMPSVHATFYGEGLVQEMAKDYKPKSTKVPKNFANVVGFAKPELISSEYRELNARLHRDNLAYGVGGEKHAPTVLKLVASLGTRSVLDYGCGKGLLAKNMPFPIWEYDPAVPGKEESPRPADLVICTDVLEHIEPDKLNYVLDDLRRVTRTLGYFVIHTKAAMKTLPDGRNTHLIQRGKRWWKARLAKFFMVGKILEVKGGAELHVVVVPKIKTKVAA